jgi:hypothetical protein
MKRLYKASVARLAAVFILGALGLAGCSGGAGTEQNPVTTGPSAGPTYSGPTPATADIQAFRVNFWENIRGADRCGNCHNAGGQSPNFARSDDVNAAYQQASGVVDRDSPSQSRIVTKVAGGHNCWLPDSGACASILTRWITDWVGASGAGARQIELVAPVVKDPGSTKRFPAYGNLQPPQQTAFTNLHDLLTLYCSDCHTSDSATSQSPYFASSNPEEAYVAVLPKINLDTPAESRLVIRLGRESHNCWDNCTNNAATMQAAIQALSDSIDASAVDTNLVVSKALTLYDGTVAAGGNRYDANVIALYEFKTGQGNTAFDTSGVDPAADLNIFGTRTTDFDWVGGWGIIFKTPTAKAQAATATSRKLHQLITATGEYSVEAWVVPGNVTQEDARIVSYSGSTMARNFTLGQTMYNYDAFSRSTATGANGTPALSTADAAERLQASLQHVVMTFDPVNGRRLYVNGEFTGDVDGSGGGTLGEWDNSFAFVLGNEVSNNRPWAGVVRLVAIHNRALTAPQVLQNFEAGVGEKFFLLFGIEHIVNVPKSYILFEATQYDSSGYLFTNPKFISLDPAAMPGSIPLEGMRIGLNGAEPHVGQAYRLLKTTIVDANYSAATGQTLSTVGTIVPLEQGPASDEFYLCFDQLGSRANVCSSFAAGVPSPVVDAPTMPSDIGVRTFDGINASMASITGVSPNTPSVKAAYANVRQSLPAVTDLGAFLSSHQTSIAQLAITYCAALVNDQTARANYFPGLNFNASIDTPSQRSALITPLIARAIGTAATQPAVEVDTELDSLISDLCPVAGSPCSDASRTPTVVKAVCGAAIGSATMLVR